jgi:hypothetical protein
MNSVALNLSTNGFLSAVDSLSSRIGAVNKAISFIVDRVVPVERAVACPYTSTVCYTYCDYNGSCCNCTPGRYGELIYGYAEPGQSCTVNATECSRGCNSRCGLCPGC